MEKEIDFVELIEKFIKGNIDDKDFIEFNEYSVRNSLINEDEDKKYIYNEMSFQHELGEYLRKRLNPTNGKNRFIIQFERNISSFKNITFSPQIKKHEIDIVIIDDDKKQNYIIELKYHKKERSRYPNTMYDCVKDIDFVDDVVNAENSNFVKGYCVTVVEDETFYNSRTNTYGENLYTNYWCFRKIADKENNYEVKKSGGNQKINPINIQQYVKKYHYLPVREKCEKEQKQKKQEGTIWNKICDEDNMKKAVADARYYIIEIKRR